MNIFIEIIGWTGTVMLVLAYLLLTLGKLQSRSWAYQIMNAAGAAAIVVNSFYYGALPGATLNAIWTVIGIVGIIGIARAAKAKQDTPATEA